ncbi:TetR family transcriptional regulator [Shimwellia blattae]|nr:TetR family transcriptional regulator [Shimwellia blattae]GAB80592.1 putative TetR family transcriptional regulator [Shimwellia blattae DSM 4481 = NBRC 105725]VDY62776.1 TetR family transcriptional regulator [Shimwellia blattae]VEC19611.1 TetR family transcriptional regulator [Shimwellia blattae]
MSYLNKTQRREIILEAAGRVALSEGLQAMTVRRIASEAQIATGQVHHHFASASALKAETFVRLSEQLLDTYRQKPATSSWREWLHQVLGSDTSGSSEYLALWRDAQQEAGHDPLIREAYIQSMLAWHQEVVAVIRAGMAGGGFSTSGEPDSIAWRLIALSCGMDGIYLLGIAGIDDRAFYQHLDAAITRELAPAAL